MSFIYWSAVGYIYKQLDHHIEYDKERLETIYKTEGKKQLIFSIENALKQKNYDSIYLLYDQKTKKSLIGNLVNIPDVQLSGWHIIDLTRLSGSTEKQNHSARILMTILSDELILINGLDIESAHEQEHMIFNSLIAGIAIILLLGTIGGFIISISTIKKINIINDTINDIKEGNLSLRIPSRGTDDDYDLLANNINQMLDQIHQLMQGMQNISNNIAHDLRTPLTRLRAHLELIEIDCSEKTSDGIREALKETDNLLSTFNAMLRINKVESGVDKGQFKTLSIDSLLQDVIEFYEPLAESKSIVLSFENNNSSEIKADRDMLFQVFANLMDNAIKYTPEHGKISISISSINKNSNHQIKVSFADTGKGIPVDEQEKVLEPFYRLEKHRDQHGNGLGLSLVSAIVKLHGGSMIFENNKPGLIINIIFPV
ncbi:MAG: HAMP domain-containing histidine kinase [Gammaproteobacteria bacterium]|nr:HAMP domain-containing histidine kinase [Gammaproteobacteria bacterium]